MFVQALCGFLTLRLLNKQYFQFWEIWGKYIEYFMTTYIIVHIYIISHMV